MHDRANLAGGIPQKGEVGAAEAVAARIESPRN